MPETELPSAKRFAVIDLEASSTKPNNRIIEVAVLIFEDNSTTMSLIETYSTLVNPELEVPSDILELTGITKEELETAPKFFEISEDLEMLTRDCILVAHNVEFDIDDLSLKNLVLPLIAKQSALNNWLRNNFLILNLMT